MARVSSRSTTATMVDRSGSTDEPADSSSESSIWFRHACIEQAKGALTALFGVDDDAAFAVLLQQSQARNIKVHVVATHVMESLRCTGASSESAESAHAALDRLFTRIDAIRSGDRVMTTSSPGDDPTPTDDPLEADDADGPRAVVHRRLAAEERDLAAARRDDLAAEADVDAESRDRAHERLDATDPPGDTRWRERARNARRAAALDRARALDDRVASRHDRRAAATDRHLMAVDELTGTYRREIGIVELAHELETARVTRQSMIVCFLDIDGFKAINDLLGHRAGDRILRRVADVIRRHLRSDDVLVRYGGDEFVFGVTGTDERTVHERIEAIDAALRREVQVSVTCGVAIATPSATIDAVINTADHDLYRRRRLARGHRAPDPRAGHTSVGGGPPHDRADRDDPARDRTVDTAVDAVLDDPQSIRSVYQPVIDLDTNTIVGYEALARWPRFPAAAAARGVVREVDWACRLAAIEGALDAGMGQQHTLFLNVEPDGPDEVPGYAETLVRAATDQLSIVVELTERSLLVDPAALLVQIEYARSTGCAIALDDIGLDPAALTLLDFIAPDIIKLDSSLLHRDPNWVQADILAAVRAHAEASGAVLLAESIENAAHLERARAYGCTLGQGFMFGEPSELPSPVAEPPATVSWTPPQRRPTARRDRPTPATPSELFGEHLTPTIGRKPLLLALTRQIEDDAISMTGPSIVLSCFQNADNFGAAVGDRYAAMARTNPFVAALGVGMSAEPAPGVRGTDLPLDDPLVDEWAIAVVGRHHFAALIARDCGDTGDDDDNRRFEFVHTFDRRTVIAAARSLMHRAVLRPPDRGSGQTLHIVPTTG